MNEIIAYFDGLCEPVNPNGIGAYGYVILKDGKEIKSGCKVIGEGEGMTNNVAEYSAIKRVLEWLWQNIENSNIILQGDSQLVVQQLNGNWKVKSETSRRFISEIRPIIEELKRKNNKISIKWIPREKNSKADMLSRVAYNRYRKRGEREKKGTGKT